jgi:hypothetical protein
LVTAAEVAELVEDAVVGQVMFRIPGDDVAAEQEGGRDRDARDPARSIKVADNDGELAKTDRRELRCEPLDQRG